MASGVDCLWLDRPTDCGRRFSFGATGAIAADVTALSRTTHGTFTTEPFPLGELSALPPRLTPVSAVVAGHPLVSRRVENHCMTNRRRWDA